MTSKEDKSSVLVLIEDEGLREHTLSIVHQIENFTVNVVEAIDEVFDYLCCPLDLLILSHHVISDKRSNVCEDIKKKYASVNHSSFGEENINLPILLIGKNEEIGKLNSSNLNHADLIVFTPVNNHQLNNAVNSLSSRKKREVELSRSKGRYKGLVNDIPLGIFVVDISSEKNNIIYENDTFIQYLNLPSDNLESITQFSSFLDDEYIDRHTEIIQRFRNGLVPTELPIEVEYRSHNGSTLDASVSAISLDWKGKPSVLFFINDISEQKTQKKQLTEKNVELEEYTRQIAHDLTAPLRTIETFSKYLGRPNLYVDDPATFTDYLSKVRSAAFQAKRQIEELRKLVYLGINTEKFELISLQTVFDRVVDGLRDTITSRAKKNEYRCRNNRYKSRVRETTNYLRL